MMGHKTALPYSDDDVATVGFCPDKVWLRVPRKLTALRKRRSTTSVWRSYDLRQELSGTDKIQVYLGADKTV